MNLIVNFIDKYYLYTVVFFCFLLLLQFIIFYKSLIKKPIFTKEENPYSELNKNFSSNQNYNQKTVDTDEQEFLAKIDNSNLFIKPKSKDEI